MKKARATACLCFAALFLGASPRVPAQTWTLTGNMNAYRTFHTTTLLNDGEVLVAGGRGIGNYNQSTAELYNPSTGTFSDTGSLNTGRVYHAAALLPSGEVLIAGGQDVVNTRINCLSSAELYDPKKGAFTFTGSLTAGLCFPTATLLNTGKVLIIGGTNAELYDPSTGAFSNTGSPNVSRVQHTATLLPSGEVLVAGGAVGTAYTATAELYDPETGTFTLTGSMHTSRGEHTATLMNNGEVLIAAGITYIGPGYQLLTSAEVYNPSTGKFTVTGSLNQYRSQQVATLLPSGEVLVASGYPTITAELYNPSKGTFKFTGSLNVERDQGAGIVLLPDGVVLVTGGNLLRDGKPYFKNSAELYH